MKLLYVLIEKKKKKNTPFKQSASDFLFLFRCHPDQCENMHYLQFSLLFCCCFFETRGFRENYILMLKPITPDPENNPHSQIHVIARCLRKDIFHFHFWMCAATHKKVCVKLTSYPAGVKLIYNTYFYSNVELS